METVIHAPDFSPPSTIVEIMDELRKAKLRPSHEAKPWGDWIHLEGFRTVISIECNHGLSSSATIEHGEGEEDGEPIDSIVKSFGKLGWHGTDEDGDYPLA